VPRYGLYAISKVGIKAKKKVHSRYQVESGAARESNARKVGAQAAGFW